MKQSLTTEASDAGDRDALFFGLNLTNVLVILSSKLVPLTLPSADICWKYWKKNSWFKPLTISLPSSSRAM